MSSKRKLIILISVLVAITLLILLVIFVLKNNQSKEENKNQKTANTDIGASLEIFNLNSEINNESDFFTVQSCINQYFQEQNNSNSEAVFNMLNNEYKEQNEINNSNVLQKIYNLQNGFEKFFANEIYYREIGYGTVYQYFVYGELLGENYETIKDIYVIANLDFGHMSFEILFDEKVELSKEEFSEIINNLKSNNGQTFYYVDQDKSEIPINDYNNFIAETEYSVLDGYVNYYNTMAVYYPDIAYNLLDEEYRSKKFENIDEFKQYVSENEGQLLTSAVSEFNISEKDGYTQYIISDTNNNYYIFKVYGIMDYKVLTDFYTVDIEEFSNSYDERNTQEEVAINIQKIVSALNNKDYKYVYSKLSDGFKQNYYPTLEDFINYISQMSFRNRELYFNDFYNEGDTNIYNITLQGTTASSGDPINMQIIMQLEENRDFVMSFNIK